jgi:hypothetical protein
MRDPGLLPLARRGRAARLLEIARDRIEVKCNNTNSATADAASGPDSRTAGAAAWVGQKTNENKAVAACPWLRASGCYVKYQVNNNNNLERGDAMGWYLVGLWATAMLGFVCGCFWCAARSLDESSSPSHRYSSPSTSAGSGSLD